MLKPQFPDYHNLFVSKNDIHLSILTYGCCLIRSAFNPRSIKKLASEIQFISTEKSNKVKCGELTETFSRFHITETEYQSFYPEKSLYDILKKKKWNDTIKAIFGTNQYYQHQETYTRGIDVRPEEERDLTSFRPLQFHLDTIYHPPVDKFSIIFWIPFDDCGTTRPGIQLVPINHHVIRRIINFDSDTGFNHTEPNIDESQWSMKNVWQRIVTTIPNEIVWRPKFSIGDLLIMSSWVPHASYTTREMNLPRRSVELRYHGNELNPLPITDGTPNKIKLFLHQFAAKIRRQNYVYIHAVDQK